jgi:hypothetical protein
MAGRFVRGASPWQVALALIAVCVSVSLLAIAAFFGFRAGLDHMPDTSGHGQNVGWPLIALIWGLGGALVYVLFTLGVVSVVGLLAVWASRRLRPSNDDHPSNDDRRASDGEFLDRPIQPLPRRGGQSS